MGKSAIASKPVMHPVSQTLATPNFLFLINTGYGYQLGTQTFCLSIEHLSLQTLDMIK